MSNFIESAESRETSPEVMEAILWVADGDEEYAEDIWENGPDSSEMVAIIERVTGNGRLSVEDFYWGAMGNHWDSFID